MMSMTCATCTDADCPRRGTDNAACEDWTNQPQAALETVPEPEPERHPQADREGCQLHAVLEARLGRLEDLVARMRRELQE